MSVFWKRWRYWETKMTRANSEDFEYPSIDRVGITLPKDESIVEQWTNYNSLIWCGWSNGKNCCNEQFRLKTLQPISIREALESAARKGWIIIGDRPVCPFHPLRELEAMEKYLEGLNK